MDATTIRVLFFGSYDAGRHPRVRVLEQGLRAHGDEVVELNVPLGVATERRVETLRRPWRIPGLLLRVLRVWLRLFRRARDHPDPDVVVVGYLGHLDVHLARFLWPDTPLVLDHLVSLSDTARDRRVGSSILHRMLEWVDRAAVRAADLVVTDSREHRALLPESVRPDSVVVSVGAPEEWFATSSSPPLDGPLRVVFFGLYTPLQGTPTIGDAIACLEDADMEFLMIGHGQDLEETRRRAESREREDGRVSVRWVDWMDPDRLPDEVAGCHVCLGIFGTGEKARRVVPNKVFQGAAAGCAVVTSDTPPQRRVLGEGGIYVPPGNSEALARALERLSVEPEYLARKREAARRHARGSFSPYVVVEPLRRRLGQVTEANP